MDTKDFIVLPWGKPGNSVKLRYRNARELRLEKVQLELENQQMEKKLQEFQSAWSKEKEERKSSGYHWKSGQLGKLGNQSHMMSQNKGNVIKLSAGKVKLKLLKEQLQEPVKQPLNYKMANPSESEKPKMKGKLCGQCENKSALLVCLECGEDYCSGCFAKIHQKGALKLHRTTLLQTKSQILSNVLDVAHQFIKEVNPDESKGENRSTKGIRKSQHQPKPLLLQGSNPEVEVPTTKRTECSNPKDRLLCEEGSCDEGVSAQPVQEALNQQRTGHHDDNEKQNLHTAKADSLEECEVQTNLKIWREPLNIEFKEDSLSYMEKLWLKKHRRTPQEQLRNMLPDTFIPQCKTASEAKCSQNESDEDSGVEETKIQHPALFLPVEELKVERPEPSLKIVELDDTYEEEYEEPGDIVSYKVELADADSQKSCTFHDYQNTFLYENDIYQHHVFTKGKTDLLHLHPNNSSSYGKNNSKGDGEWMPDHSVSAFADNAVALGVLQSAQNPSVSRTEQKMGQIPQRPSTANLPLSSSVKKSSSCLGSSHPRSKSAAARSLSRAASEISEIEYIDITDHNEPFLDGTADQQALESLEKELNMLRNLADPSEKLYSLTSEELPAFNNHSLNISQTTLDFRKTSSARGPCTVEEWSSSERDTETQSLLTLSESSTDEEEEDFLDKQHVITLPWS
ncbi:zinc finger B-box domain-containing protein 1 isoform X6 [Canis lupus familiaris]|uniref:zinc finger B-box domain-containing protein 1 isoform X6 n=1 Tax=Canis lupus familiaris TaxID=9615 RepID=UPI0018F3D8E6|nr:zinc finger B-box domain-containing protein 1 isoform X6 [Canis lupus familiaris]XP_038439731.1 zinc finger B-box domain-containing protein 1 isoform X6 [Canis lupus familiaris]